MHGNEHGAAGVRALQGLRVSNVCKEKCLPCRAVWITIVSTTAGVHQHRATFCFGCTAFGRMPVDGSH